jgi:hypothetical protein
MMNNQDRAAIEGLFERMAEFGRQGAPRDADAERLIAQHLASQPGAAYYMAQTIIVQEQALKAAQERLDAAERAAQEPAQEKPSGGFLSSVWGSGRQSEPAQARRGSVPSFGRRDEREDYGQQPGYGQQGGFGQQGGMMQGRGGGGGFLAGAAQTAMGVAGGVMLGNMIGGMFGGGAAHAATPDATPAAAADTNGDAGAENVADTGADEGGGGMFDQLFGGGDDSGGGFDDGGGFDEA